MGLKLKKPDDVAGSAFPAIIIGMFVAFGGVLFGYVASPLFHLDITDAVNVQLRYRHHRW
jgi:hypothetical protein